jgi:hypothetical protein
MLHGTPTIATDAQIIEWAPFRLKSDVTDAELLAASDSLQRNFLSLQDGFVGRELLRCSNCQWADLVYWRDEQSANAVMQAVAESPVCNAYFQLMDGLDAIDPGAGVLHLRRVQTY